jgi:AmiR/NasT family two-component response regulator
MKAQNSSFDPSREKWQGTTEELPNGFHQLRIIVIHPRDQDGEFLLRNLQRLRCRVDLLWPPPDRIEAGADITFCLLQADTYALCCELMHTRQSAIAGIVDPGNPRAPQLLAAAGPQVVLTKPFDATAILTNAVVAYKNFRYEKRLLSKIAKLEETLRSIRTVERAKLILMQARKIDETEAYAFLRDQAMKKRLSIGRVAAVVVESGNILLGSKD